MQNIRILTKIQKLLLIQNIDEHGLLSLFKEIRSYIEISMLQKSYHALWFYCNIMLHPKLNHNDAKEIIKKIKKAFIKISEDEEKNKEVNSLHLDIINSVGFGAFISEFIRFVKNNNLIAHLFSKIEKLTLNICKLLDDKRIEFPEDKDKKSLNTHQKISDGLPIVIKAIELRMRNTIELANPVNDILGYFIDDYNNGDLKIIVIAENINTNKPVEITFNKQRKIIERGIECALRNCYSRNDICFCGSTIKYKKCCGKQQNL